MQIELNGKELHSTWKIRVSNYQGIFDFPSYKHDVTQSWPDQNGLEVLNIKDENLFEPRNITLDCICLADNTADLYNNIENFRNELRKSGLSELYFIDINIGFAVYRVEKKDIVIKQGNYGRFQMILINPFPTKNFIYSSLKDDSDKVLKDDNDTVLTGKHQQNEL